MPQRIDFSYFQAMQPVEKQTRPVAEAHIGHDLNAAALAVLGDHFLARLLRHLLAVVGGEVAEHDKSS